ncbi:helix-turn-helix transcriptional regulator [Cohnella phaseoli]|uniref:AraC-like protein n=1 Tax=Cohnella phaseoli TaxID=456490 RepID=A0A3D9HTA7_9BACL|nr:AraC family transcriptional regulator [Cohnella phaseoli]RED52660.1 AraC-like protein [Cohnella phaseoli]
MKIQHLPERLLNDQYMDSLSSFRMYRHTLDQEIGTHWHQFYELGLVVSGTGTHHVNGVPFRVERGHAFLLTPADFHRIVPDAGQTLRLYNLIFTERIISDDLAGRLFERGNSYSCEYGQEKYADAEHEFERIIRESDNWRELSGIVVKGCIERLLVDLCRSCPPSDAKSYKEPDLSIHPSIRKALVYLQHHFREQLLLEDVARFSGLSVNYFSESFSKQTGHTFQTHVRDMRLGFAKSLIEATDLPITEICYAAGFNTLAYFLRAFKARYRMSPRQLRGSMATGAGGGEREEANG